MLLGFKNLTNFVKLYIGYHSSKFQISWLSGSNFMEASVRHQKAPIWRHYDVISYYWVSKLAYFVEHDIGYRPSLGCVDQILWKADPSATTR